MKENEKQAIDEMAAVIASAIEFDELDFGMDEKTEIIAEKAAEAFYSKGYRKQSEGEWKKWGIMFYCSKCTVTNYDKSKFCPNCGAHMKGGAE